MTEFTTNLAANDIETEEDLLLEDDGKYTIDRGVGVGQNKYGGRYRDNNYIESENKYDNLRALDLNFANDDIGAYTGKWKDIDYSNANAATMDKYGNAYNTENVGNENSQLLLSR
jgi:hypothetical protein